MRPFTYLPAEEAFGQRAPRRAAMRAVGGAWAALASLAGLSAATASAKNVRSEKKGKKGKRGQQGPIGPVGPAGPQGNQGLNGAQGERGPAGSVAATQFEVDSTPRVVPTDVGEYVTSHIPCPGTTVVTGGGYSLTSSTGTFSGNFATVAVVASFANNNGWQVVAARVAAPTSPEDLRIQATAVCGL